MNDERLGRGRGQLRHGAGSRTKIRRITAAAAFAAVVFAAILFTRIPIPRMQGIAHLGDSMIILASYVLGGPVGACAAAIGAFTSNVWYGIFHYAPATFVIKALMALAAGHLARRGTLVTYIGAAVAAGAINVAGYFLYEFALFGSAYAFAELFGNCVQSAATVAASAVLWTAAARLKRAANWFLGTVKQ